MSAKHYPVMLNECVEMLALKDDGVYFDGTLGFCGHTGEILKRTKNSVVYATDLDQAAIDNAKEVSARFYGRLKVFHDNFRSFSEIKESENIAGFDGIIVDLGISSVQVDDRSRGFSYLAEDEPIDMRMDVRQKLSAKDILNEYSEKQISKILYEYGEERFALKIAENIVRERQRYPIETCGQLVSIIVKSIPMKFQQNGHPAKKTFQALRIETNGELDGLEKALRDMVDGLNAHGRLVALTFNSLEDRIVKNTFKDLATDCICDKSLPVCVCGRTKKVDLVNKKPITASEKELSENSRSKSAKLRVVEKV